MKPKDLKYQNQDQRFFLKRKNCTTLVATSVVNRSIGVDQGINSGMSPGIINHTSLI